LKNSVCSRITAAVALSTQLRMFKPSGILISLMFVVPF